MKNGAQNGSKRSPKKAKKAKIRPSESALPVDNGLKQRHRLRNCPSPSALDSRLRGNDTSGQGRCAPRVSPGESPRLEGANDVQSRNVSDYTEVADLSSRSTSRRPTFRPPDDRQATDCGQWRTGVLLYLRTVPLPHASLNRDGRSYGENARSSGLTSGRTLEPVEREIPQPGAGQVRIKVQACGICHSDSLVKEGYFPGIQYPRVPGHEVVGVVDAVGAGRSRMEGGRARGCGLERRLLRILRRLPPRRFHDLPNRPQITGISVRRRLRGVHDRARRGAGARFRKSCRLRTRGR